jgi:23S rRNA pseudouridine955/2504/2580 synthase
MRSIKITDNEKEQRLDRFLTKYLNNTTKTNIYKLIRKKRIKVNGKKTTEKYFLSLDDEVEIHLHENAIDELMKEEIQLSAEDVDLDIVYEDEEILIVNKPVGLLTHPDKKEYKDTLATKVQLYLKHLVTRTFKPASIQRLDKNTSGLVVFGKTYDALKKYNALMKEREIGKFYETVVHGQVLKESGEVKGYLVKDEERNKISISKNERPGSKFVHTKYRVIKSNNQFSYLEVELLTGRAHQIRGSLSYIGHPIVGDTKYGGKKVKGVTTQLLHAYKVVLNGKQYRQSSDQIQGFISKNM